MEKSKLGFRESVGVDCFGKDGFLKWAEKDQKDIPLIRSDIRQGEWEKIKRHVVKQKNSSYNL